jgi:hypothetical protein
VVGDEPEIRVNVDFTTDVDGALHYYTGSLSVPGCGRGESELAAEIEVEADHVSLSSLADFIWDLGPESPPQSSSPGAGDVGSGPGPGRGCGCGVQGGGGARAAQSYALLLVLGLWGRRRARRATCARDS